MEKIEIKQDVYPNKPEAKTDNSLGNHFGNGCVDNDVYSWAKSERTN